MVDIILILLYNKIMLSDNLIVLTKTYKNIHDGGNEMLQTYKNFKTLSNLYKGGNDINAMAIAYQNTEDTVILAKVYCEMYGALVNRTNRYQSITEDEKASYITTEMHKALLDYDPQKGASAKTFVLTYVVARLNSVIKSQHYNKRVVTKSSTSYQVMTENSNDDLTDDGVCFATTEVNEFLDKLNLTENELKCCKIIMNEPKNLMDTEIAKLLGMTSAGVAHLKKRIAMKYTTGLAMA